MPSIQDVTLHSKTTIRRGLYYEFTPKHHGAVADAARWLTELALKDEFATFNRADGIVVENEDDDNQQISDDDGNLYGYERLPNGSLRQLGTWYQQLAEFPVQSDGANWHGYPIWPLNNLAPQNRQGDKCRPDKQVFHRLVKVGAISIQQRKRLSKGDHV